MRREEIEVLFNRADQLPQSSLIPIEILERKYWVCGQDLYNTQNGYIIKLELATKNFEDIYCSILVSPKEFEELIENQESEKNA